MANVIGDVILGALVIALNPLVIILVILLVLSKRGRTNSTYFLLGWFSTLVLMGWLVIFLAEAGHISAGAERTTTMSILKLLFGILFLFLAAYYWKKRPAPGQPAEVPPWMDSIDNFTSRKSLTTGIAIAGANPKNIGITIAASQPSTLDRHGHLRANMQPCHPGDHYLQAHRRKIRRGNAKFLESLAGCL
jgi:hypothetical protein